MWHMKSTPKKLANTIPKRQTSHPNTVICNNKLGPQDETNKL